MEKTDVIEWLTRFNEEINAAYRFSFPVRDKALKSATADSLNSFLDELESQRIDRRDAQDADGANLFLGLCCYARSMIQLLQMWIALRDDDAIDAWDSLVGAQDSARAAMRAHQLCASKLNDYIAYLDSMEQILFPPQQFVSFSYAVRDTDCSLCNAPYHKCDHVAGLPYNGEFCVEVIRKVSTVDQAAVADLPVDKRCRTTSFSEIGYDVDSFTLRRTHRDDDKDKRTGEAMANKWFFKQDGKQVGPIIFDQMKSLAGGGDISPHTEVRREIDRSWFTARCVPGWFLAAKSEEAPPVAEGESAGEEQELEDPKAVVRADVMGEPKAAKEEVVATQEKHSQRSGSSVEIVNSIGMKLKLIPAGEFMMGAPESNDDAHQTEKPQHKVRITKPFYLGVYLVTQAEYEQVMAKNPSRFEGATRPVESVSWDDAVEFCQKLSSREGWVYRLPTEAEWEYACRANTTTRYSFGDDPASLGECAYYAENSYDETHPVGEKKPNAWGLYDMHGNVCEWCADWHEWGYPAVSPTDDPTGPETGLRRVCRGGSWLHGPGNCQSTHRYKNPPAYRTCDLGFRVAAEPSGK